MQVYSKYFLITACTIFQGEKHFVGLSSSFTLSQEVIKFLDGGLTLEQAAFNSGFTDIPKLGKFQGCELEIIAFLFLFSSSHIDISSLL